MVIDPTKVSYSNSIEEAIGWFVFWIIASAVSVLIPYGLGVLVPVVGILVGLGDIESTTTGPAIAGAFFTAFLAWAINDQIGMVLYFIAVILGIVSLFK